MSFGLFDVAQKAAKTFRTFEPGEPDLIKLGIGPVDRLIGGVGPGTLVVIGLPTGVGKSSLALHMLLNGKDRGHYASLEDPEDLIGARILAEASGVSSLRIRRKDFQADDVDRLQKALVTLRERDKNDASPIFDIMIGKGMDKVEESVRAAREKGARRSIFDYLQKMRGLSDDRRSEVGGVLGRHQGVCYEQGMVPIVFSQFTRLGMDDRPRIKHFKESGDIENEARIAIVGWKDPAQSNAVRFCLEKSTYGGAGYEWSMFYDKSGSLREHDEADNEGEEF